MPDNEIQYPGCALTDDERRCKRADFGRRMADVADKLRDSHIFFYLQKAYPEDADNFEWGDFQRLMDDIKTQPGEELK